MGSRGAVLGYLEPAESPAAAHGPGSSRSKLRTRLPSAATKPGRRKAARRLAGFWIVSVRAHAAAGQVSRAVTRSDTRTDVFQRPATRLAGATGQARRRHEEAAGGRGGKMAG